MRGGHVSHQAPFLLSTCPHSSSPLSQKKAWAWAQCTWDRQPGARAVGWAQLHRPAHPHRPDLQTVGLPRPFSAEIAWKMSSCGVCNVNSGDATGIQAPQGCARLQGFLRPEKTLGFSFPIRGGNGWQWPKAGSGPQVEGSIWWYQLRTCWVTQVKRMSFGKQGADFFQKGPHSNYWRLCRLDGLCPTTQLCHHSHRQCASGWACLCFNKASFIKTGDAPGLAQAL